MKKVVLSLVAAMIAVVSFAQPLALRSVQQNLSVAGAKLTTAKKSLGVRPMLKNVQAPSTSLVKKGPRKAAEGEFSVADLAGDYISAMYTYDLDSLGESLVPAIPACETGMVSIEPGEGNEITIYGLLSLYGYEGEESAGVKATVNLEDFTLTIPNNQVIAYDEDYGAIKMVNMDSEGDFTATIYSNGIHIEQIWAATILYQGEEVRYSDFFETMLMFPNGAMSFKGPEEELVETYVAVEQDPETKALTVYNFGNFGAVLDITIESDKTFSIDPTQPVAYYSKQGTYYPYALDEDYLEVISGYCTENTLTSTLDWTFYSDMGYWYGQMGPFTIELAGELEFPAMEVGTLVVAPQGLTTVDYPMSATLYTDVSAPYSSTVKVGWADSTVYIQGLDKDFPEAWVMGKLNEKNYIRIAPTYMGSKDGVSHFFGAYTTEGVDTLVLTYDPELKNMEAAGTVMIYKGMKTINFVYFYNGLVLGVKPSPVALPAGVETTEMPFMGGYMTEDMQEPVQKTGVVQVGRDGQDVYIKGLFEDVIPEGGWIKGTFYNDSIVVFAMNQYTGVLYNNLSAYLVGYDYETSDAGVGMMVYNAENNFFTTVNAFILTRFKSSFSLFTAFYQAGLTIGSNPASIKSVEKASMADKSAYYTLNGVRVAQPTQKGIYIHNGKKIVVK